MVLGMREVPLFDSSRRRCTKIGLLAALCCAMICRSDGQLDPIGRNRAHHAAALVIMGEQRKTEYRCGGRNHRVRHASPDQSDIRSQNYCDVYIQNSVALVDAGADEDVGITVDRVGKSGGINTNGYTSFVLCNRRRPGYCEP
jgi:hypothetical protein